MHAEWHDRVVVAMENMALSGNAFEPDYKKTVGFELYTRSDVDDRKDREMALDVWTRVS